MCHNENKMNGENNKVCLVEIRKWDYDYLEVDEVRLFVSRDKAEETLRNEGFEQDGANSWGNLERDVDAEIRECEVEG